MTLKANSYSRFRDTPTILQDGEEVWGTWHKQSFLTKQLPQSQQTAYRVGNDKEGRPDLIAQELYGTSKLDWLLIAHNDALDVFNWPRAGTVITAPITSVVLGEVL